MTTTHKEMIELLYKANCLAILQLSKGNPNINNIDRKFEELKQYLTNVVETAV